MNAELLTVSQTAQYLQLSEKTIRRMIGSGTLPASKLGNHTWRIRAQDVDEYVASSRQNKAVSEKSKAFESGNGNTRTSTAYFPLFRMRRNGPGIQKGGF